MTVRAFAIVSKSTDFSYLPTILYRDVDTYIRMSTHFERCVYLRLPLESVNPVFQRISTVYIDIWLRFPACSKSLFGRSGSLLLHPALLPTLVFRVALQLHEETDAWRRWCQTWNRTYVACAARAAIWKLSRYPVSSIVERDMPSFQNCIRYFAYSRRRRCEHSY